MFLVSLDHTAYMLMPPDGWNRLVIFRASPRLFPVVTSVYILALEVLFWMCSSRVCV